MEMDLNCFMVINDFKLFRPSVAYAVIIRNVQEFLDLWVIARLL